jgi:hypothetical protein
MGREAVRSYYRINHSYVSVYLSSQSSAGEPQLAAKRLTLSPYRNQLQTVR